MCPSSFSYVSKLHENITVDIEKTIAFYIETKVTVTKVLRNIRDSEEKNGLLTCSAVVVSETRSTDT